MQTGGRDVSNNTATRGLANPAVELDEDDMSLGGFALVRILEDAHSTCEWNGSYGWGNGTSLPSHEPQYPDTLELVSILMCLFNAAANGFSFAIFRNKAFNKSIMSELLLGLSLFEVAFQLGQAGYVGVNVLRGCCIRPMRSRALAVGLSAVAVVTRQMAATFQLARNWTLAALSLYRYEAVCRSMSNIKLFRKENSRLIVLLIGAMCTLIMLPRLFEAYEIVCYYQATGHYVLKSTNPYPPVMANEVYQLFYLSACLFIMQSGGPTITVLICSAFVLKILWARQRFRQTQNMRQRQSGTDKLIIMLALTFFVLEMPAFFSKLLFSSKALQPATDILMSKIANTLITLDSSLNIFIYLFSNPTFLQVTKQMLVCWPQHSGQGDNNGHQAPGGTAPDGPRGGPDGAAGGSREESLGTNLPTAATAAPPPPPPPATQADGQPSECQALMSAVAYDYEDDNESKEADDDQHRDIQGSQSQNLELRVTEV